MRIRYAESYIDQILSAETGDRLIELLCAFSGRSEYDLTKPDLGLPEPAFLLMECSQWLAHSLRSGVVTYYEATPVERQKACLAALQTHAPREWSAIYSQGILCWKDRMQRTRIDKWLEDNKDTIDLWLHDFARAHRPTIVDLLCR